jgi:hypothetical protein
LDRDPRVDGRVPPMDAEVNLRRVKRVRLPISDGRDPDNVTVGEKSSC